MLQLEVRDTGIGMTAEEMAGLFQPYYRVDSTHRTGLRGTGLGLAICRLLARKLGGEVTVQSRPGAGSAFALTLPLDVPPPAREPPSPRPDGPRDLTPPSDPASVPRLNARILLAEDHDANRQLLSLRLSRAGAEVVPARNGREALEQVRDAARAGQPIDAVIMDMEMPVLDGYEAVRQLRAGGYSGPIIAVTAYAMAKDREECLDLGCDDHITKPIEWHRFFHRLSELLARRDGGPEGVTQSPEHEP